MFCCRFVFENVSYCTQALRVILNSLQLENDHVDFDPVFYYDRVNTLLGQTSKQFIIKVLIEGPWADKMI